jgi:hypothetical protein
MISKISLRAAVALAALALTAPALAQQAAKQEPRFGVGVGLTGSSVSGSAAQNGTGSPDFGTLFFVPLNLAPHFRLEPFLGWARASLDNVPVGVGGNQQFSPFLQGKSSDITFGVGGFYVAPVAPQVQVYLGGRLASQWQSIQDNAGDKASRRNTILAAALGGEYLPVPRVAFGGELQLGLIWYGDTDYTAPGASISGGGGSGSATQGTLFVRFYLL